jgi:hypothetical protein
MENAFNIEEVVFGALLIGTIAMLTLTLGFIFVSVKGIKRRQHIHKEQEKLTNVLLEEIHHLQNDKVNEALEREEFLNNFLERLYTLFSTVEEEGLVESDRYEDWEDACVNIYNTINSEFARLKPSTHFFKNIDLPLSQLIKSYINIINKYAETKVSILVNTHSSVADSTKVQVFHILQALTLLSKKEENYQLNIEETIDGMIIQFEGNIQDTESNPMLLHRLSVIERSFQATVDLTQVDQKLIEILLPVRSKAIVPD